MARSHKLGPGGALPDGVAALLEAGPAPSVDAREAAAGLLGLADGLSVAVLLEPARVNEQRAHRLVDAAVDALLQQG